MAKNNTGDRKSSPPHDGKPRKPGDAIKDRDLDKVTGGLRSTGAPRPGDPCDGGE
jgi:hypothetical protein